MPATVAYLLNQYPKVSHSFIRREIAALERRGVQVSRFAMRGWDAEVVDSQDIEDRTRTRYLLADGILPLLLSTLWACIVRPWGMLRALRMTLQLSRRAERPLPVHLIYLAEACRLAGWLNATDIKHIHAHFGTNATEVALLACCLGDYRYSFTVHGPEEFDKPTTLHLEEKIRHAAFVVAISSFGQSQLYRWTEHRQWHRISVVHCGLEQEFSQTPSAMTTEAPRRFVCVGRLCEQKGQLILIEAVRILAAKNLQFELVLAGDGEMRPEIERLVTRYGLAHIVSITGWISSEEVRRQLLASRALVLPSFAEGLPVVIMEAMALRRPVLSTYVAGIPELVIDGENGWLFPAGSVEALAEAMMQCLDTPLGDLQRMGDACHDRVLARHSIDAEAEKLIRLFDAVASPAASTIRPAP